MEISWNGLHVFYTYICIPKNITNNAQYVTPYSEIYCDKVKMCCGFSLGIWFSCITFMQLAVAGKRRNTVVVHLQKRV